MNRLTSLTCLAFALISPARAAEPGPFIPLPKSVVPAAGSLTLPRSSRIIATSAPLAPLSEVLAKEIQLTKDVQLATATGNGQAGDIVLKIDPALNGEAYRLTVTDRVIVVGGNYQAVASGTVTLLQALRSGAGSLELPLLEIADEPTYSFRGALIDPGRKYHSPGGIEQVIDLCRFYKIRYLHLHLTDDQLFMFPSTRFPQIGRSNREFARFEPGSMPQIPPYTLEELRGLEAYAKDRGVFIVPELDLPGHSGRLIADGGEIFGFPGNGSTVNIASAKTFEAITILMNEVMDVFQSTPYIHLGADEVGLGGIEETQEYKDAQAKFGIKDAHELYCKFVVDLHSIVAKRGKQAIVWEEAWNADGTYPLPKEAIVMSWTHGRNPADIVKSGYQVINASWTPLYIVRADKRPLDFLFDWKVPMFGQGHLGNDDFTTLPETASILGAQMCSWENSENIEIQSLRERLALVAEKTWSPAAGGTLDGFKARLAHTDSLLEKIVNPIEIVAEGDFTGENENNFTGTLTLTLKPRIEGHQIRYTLDNSMPNENWLPYTGPITTDQTAHLRAGLFDGKGVRQGRLVGSWYHCKVLIKPNLATGKTVTASTPAGIGNGETGLVVDGKADNADNHWDGGPGPQWIQVDLGKTQPVNHIGVITYWDGGRSYQLNVEVSTDGTNWKQVLDFSDDTAPATATGYGGNIPETEARFVRVNMLRNSANPSVHVVEVIVDHK
jgi:hexosaminidase